MLPQDNPRILHPEFAYSERELAEFLGCKPKKLQCDRYMNRGLPYVKVGSGSIRYLGFAVLDYLKSNQVYPGAKK